MDQQPYDITKLTSGGYIATGRSRDVIPKGTIDDRVAESDCPSHQFMRKLGIVVGKYFIPTFLVISGLGLAVTHIGMTLRGEPGEGLKETAIGTATFFSGMLLHMYTRKYSLFK